MARWLALALGILAPLASASGGEVRRLVLVPFENVARVSSARSVVMRAVAETLERAGYEVLGGASVDEQLEKRRIRHLDSIAPQQVKELVAATRADAVVVGSILAWDPDALDPSVALVTRIVGADGSLLWCGASSRSAADSEGALGLGRVQHVELLATGAVEELYAGLDLRGEFVGNAPPPRKNGLRVYRSSDPLQRPLTVAVLPFENWTASRDAVRVFEAVVVHQLSARGDIRVAEPTAVRRAVRTYPPTRLVNGELRDLAKATGARYVLGGTLFEYARSGAEGGATSPRVDLYVSLVDTETGRVVWSGTHRRSGRDYQRILQRGGILQSASLAHAVVGELIAAFTHR